MTRGSNKRKGDTSVRSPLTYLGVGLVAGVLGTASVLATNAPLESDVARVAYAQPSGGPR